MRSKLLAAFAAALLSPFAAAQQDWPSRPVVLINPFAAASAVDVVSRLVAQQLSQSLGRSFVVENRTGASGNIGTEAVAKSKPDGYTFLVGSPGSMAINPFMFKKLPYDAVADFAPVTTLVSFPQVLIVNPKLPVTNLAELIAYVKARPGKLNFASSGSGSTAHLAMEMVKSAAGLDMVHVPFRGGAPATQAVICSCRTSNRSHDPPCPFRRAGRTAATTAPTSSSVNASTPASRVRPSASAAATYRRAVLRSTPARSATFRSPAPSSQPRSTSRTSTTLTSLNPTAVDLHVVEHDVAIQRAD